MKKKCITKKKSWVITFVRLIERYPQAGKQASDGSKHMA
jgi:hypothetical protein